MPLTIKDSELNQMLDDVASDLTKIFDSTAAQIAKAEKPLRKDEPPKDDDSSGGDAPPAEGSESSGPPADASASAGGPPPPPAAGPSPDASASPEGMDPAADASAALTPEALQAEYAKLPPDQLDMHLKAALAAKAALAGGGAGPMDPAAAGGMPPAGPPAPPDASASAGAPPPPPAGPPAMKAEIAASPERNGKNSIDVVAKSESMPAEYRNALADLTALVKKQNDVLNMQAEQLKTAQAELKDAKEDVENLAKFAKTVAEQPLRKAITTVAHVPKVEAPKRELTRENIHAHLKVVSSRPTLQKSDRTLINDFYDGKVKIDKLEHLFADFK